MVKPLLYREAYDSNQLAEAHRRQIATRTCVRKVASEILNTAVGSCKGRDANAASQPKKMQRPPTWSCQTWGSQ